MCTCSLLQSTSQWPNGKTKQYAQTVDKHFCSFTAIMSDHDDKPENLLPAAVRWPKIFGHALASKWHLIPAKPTQCDNLREDQLVYATECEAVLARYFGQNLLFAATALTGVFEDGNTSVPVPSASSQNLRTSFTKAASKAAKELLKVPEYDTNMKYLKDNGWWHIARPVDTAEDMMDLLQPLLACQSWDWHGATAARVIMRWAGLLSIVSLENANVDQFTAHLGEPESWQKEGSDYLCYVPLARTLEGSPRGHPSNVNVRYIKGNKDWLTVANIERDGDQLDELFENLLKDGKTPTRQTTADGCATLNGMQVASAEVKTSWDATNAGFDQQAILLTDFFSRRNFLEETPVFPIGIHFNSKRIRIQTLHLDYDQASREHRTLMSRYVYESRPYTLQFSIDSADNQIGTNMPAIVYWEGGTVKAVPDLDWDTVKPRFQPYLVAIMQAVCKLCALYAENNYGLQGEAFSIGSANNGKWSICTQLPHQTPRGDALPQAVQNCFYDVGWEVYKRVEKRPRSPSRSPDSGPRATATASGVRGMGSGAPGSRSGSSATGS